MLARAAALALAFTLTACGYEEPVPEPQPLLPGDASLERMELSLNGEGAEVELFFTSPAGCPVVPSTFAAQLNGVSLAVQEPGHFGWVMRPACAAGEQGPECEGTVLTLGCEAPRATVMIPRSALVDGPLELQVGETRFSYPVSLSALAWHVVPTADGSLQMNWGGPVAPTSSKAVVQRAPAPALEIRSDVGHSAQMILPQATSQGMSHVEVVTSVVVSAPGAPVINLTVRQVLAVQ